jgi:uncharacterized BrkB/YihY/UPF0761 family membrane protein
VLVNGAVTVISSLIVITGVDVFRLVAPLLALVVAIVVCFVVYVVVPVNGPSPRAARKPALVAGAGIGLLTVAFGLVAPLLVQGFAALGVIASVFAALVWLNLVFQVLLYGAAWSCIRRDRERAKSAIPRI